MKKHAKKGMELPLNTLVILAIVIIVLLAVAALFMGVWGPTGGGVSLTSAKTNYCAKLLNTGTCGNADLTSITINDFDADNDGRVDAGTYIDDRGSETDLLGLTTTSRRSDATDADIQDNLLTLCIYQYGCSKTGFTTDEQVRNCCRKDVCGCPQV